MYTYTYVFFISPLFDLFSPLISDVYLLCIFAWNLLKFVSEYAILLVLVHKNARPRCKGLCNNTGWGMFYFWRRFIRFLLKGRQWEHVRGHYGQYICLVSKLKPTQAVTGQSGWVWGENRFRCCLDFAVC